MGTGEGKSIICAMVAAFFALSGFPVDVVSSNPTLARDDAKDFTDFYTFLDLSVGHNTEKDSKGKGQRACYRMDIVYGDIGNYQGDILEDEFLAMGTRGRRYGYLLYDEVDNGALDGRNSSTRLSGDVPGAEWLGPLLIATWLRLQVCVMSSQNHNQILYLIVMKIYREFFINAFSFHITYKEIVWKNERDADMCPARRIRLFKNLL